MSVNCDNYGVFIVATQQDYFSYMGNKKYNPVKLSFYGLIEFGKTSFFTCMLWSILNSIEEKKKVPY